MYNKAILEGHLGKDPEMRFTPDGKAVTKFSLAVNSGKDKKPLWVRVTAWENLAEICNSSLKTGSHVLVDGQLSEPGVWIDKTDNKPMAMTEITANKVVFLDKKEN